MTGEFGVVQKGHYYHRDKGVPTVVAIKSLKGMISVLKSMIKL